MAQDEKAGAILCFEKDNGDLDAVTARDFMRQLRGNVFLLKVAHVYLCLLQVNRSLRIAWETRRAILRFVQ